MLIREKDKKTLIQIFADFKIPLEVWAYGSRVHGTAHEGSDLDLVVRGPNLQPLPYNVFVQICEKIKDSNIPS
jgi:predicted nucleotidyltransferase